MSKKVLILYHKDCPDGFGGAYSAWKKFGNKADYIAVSPQELPLKFPKNADIYAIDVSYPIDAQRKLLDENSSLTVIDHHISGMTDTKKAPEYVFSLDHSGSVLAWKYFHPHLKVPKLLEYIEDIDLWRFSIADVDSIMAYAFLKPYDFRVWDAMVKEIETLSGRKKYKLYGSIIKEYENATINDVAKKAQLVKFQGKSVYAVNSSLRRITSMLAHNLVKTKHPFSVVWYIEGGIIHASLRSNGAVDVSKIAAKYGGGGHKRSAGFSIPLKSGFPWATVQKTNK